MCKKQNDTCKLMSLYHKHFGKIYVEIISSTFKQF